MIEFQLTAEYIELAKLLKLTRVAESGGMAKLWIETGEVLRNGVPELRKRAKIHAGEVIEVQGVQIQIIA